MKRKLLVLAAESENNEEIANAIDNVLSRCVTAPADFKVRDLALFDIEFLFLKARAKSIGEKIELRITDPNDSHLYSTEHSLNIDTIKVKKNPDHRTLLRSTKRPRSRCVSWSGLLC